MSYLLDANVFIQAKNLHYGLDFCLAFWDWLLAGNAQGRVFSIDKVRDEIAAGEDELTQWVRDHAGMFRATDTAVAARFSEVSTWANNQGYEPAAVNTFLQVADFYLVAHALAGGHVLVTHEVPANSTRRIKIPNACAGLDVSFMTPLKCCAARRRFLFWECGNEGWHGTP